MKKCGGTFLNNWLSLHAPDSSVWQEDNFETGVLMRRREFIDNKKGIKSDFFEKNRVLYSHFPLLGLMPEHSFCFTVVRDPISRVVSQFADWRREAKVTHTGIPKVLSDAVRDAANMDLRSYLLRHRHGELKFLFDNYQVRALSSLWNNQKWNVDFQSDLVEVADQNIKQNLSFVGINEHMDETISVICSRLGLIPPAKGSLRLNEAGKIYVQNAEIEDALDILSELTTGDDILYQRCKDLFLSLGSDERYFSVEDFQRFHSSHALKRLSPVPATEGNGFTFSVKDCIFASGIHGRDGSLTDQCAVWTGPQNISNLLIPIPKNKNIIVRLFVRGYASLEARRGLTISANGIPVQFSAMAWPGYAECLYFNYTSNIDSVNVKLQVPETSVADGDIRRRGISFDSYGWIIDADADADATRLDLNTRGDEMTKHDPNYFTDLNSILKSCDMNLNQAIMVHIDYLAHKAGVESNYILEGGRLQVHPDIYRDAIINIDATLKNFSANKEHESLCNVDFVISESQRLLHGWCSDEKAAFIAALLAEYKPEICVEIGVYGGRSLIPAAAALKANNQGVIFGIETWNSQVATEYATNDVNDEWWSKVDFKLVKSDLIRFILDHDLVEFVKFVEFPSSKASNGFFEIDYLHIDGAHSVFNAAEDVVLYAKKVKKGGVIIMDDANWKTTNAAVQILDALGSRIKTFTDEENNINCIVFRKN
ncbi:class I SAM-dependent methyltransferase [Pannonibacter indicus]|uniref:class I SAM-dependent methyltransferase n=1 Tax=Pannonibacter indicus TaxID=466044 RepID=UPI0039193A98